MTVARQNWSGNIHFHASAYHEPTSLPELQRLAAGSKRMRVLGTGHTFNEIADTTGDLVSLQAMPERIEIDADAGRVTVSGGTTYGRLGQALQEAGLALPNTGSLPHICIAGASSTGTHGSGNTLGNLTTVVSGVEMVTATGDLVTATRASHPDTFDALTPALGALGVLTSLTLDVVPTFLVRQYVYDDLPFDDWQGNAQEIAASAYSTSVFTVWSPRPRTTLWRKVLATAGEQPGGYLGAVAATAARHPIAGIDGTTATQQLGVPGPWNERLPHFRMDFTPSAGEEIQSEWLIARDDLVPAWMALQDLAADFARVLLVSELRTVAADERWLSPSYRRDSACLHFTWIRDEEAIAPVIADIEARLHRFDARPHWGKRFSTTPERLAQLYPRMADFRALAAEYDPDGVFRNDFVGRVLSLDAL